MISVKETFQKIKHLIFSQFPEAESLLKSFPIYRSLKSEAANKLQPSNKKLVDILIFFLRNHNKITNSLSKSYQSHIVRKKNGSKKATIKNIHRGKKSEWTSVTTLKGTI